MSFPKVFEIAGRALVVESPFSKVTREISTFRKLYISFFQKLAHLEISKNFRSAGFAGLQITGCNATYNANQISYTVCNFESMKSPVELNSLLSKFFCYITWFVISSD